MRVLMRGGPCAPGAPWEAMPAGAIRPRAGPERLSGRASDPRGECHSQGIARRPAGCERRGPHPPRLVASHPPAGATTILVAFGSLQQFPGILNLLIGVLLMAAAGEAVRRMRHPYFLLTE